jgi:diguanylate cyclase (GGDEF)-like protein/PAS domain S-box-containing protein
VPASELKVLLLEDVDTDAELALRELRRAGMSHVSARAENEAQFREALAQFQPDIVLSDFSLPHFDGLSALRIVRAASRHMPFIFVSGTIGEDRAVESLREGATDYVLKTKLSRLPQAVARAVAESGERAARAQAEEALRLTQQAVESSLDPVIITRDQTQGAPIVYVNHAFERITGYSAAEAVGRNCNFLQRGDRAQPDLVGIRTAVAKGQEVRALLRNYRKDGSLFWNELHITPVRRPDSEEITHFVGVVHDVTETRRYQEQLERQANYDALTGLPNRHLLHERLAQLIAGAQRHERKVLVLFVDLDNFKLVNDSLGHVIGDKLLCVIAERLVQRVRHEDTVARVGGDEFVVILTEQGDASRSHEAIERIHECVAQPCQIDGHELAVTASIGVAMYPHDAADAHALLRLADVAMYRSKELGRSGYQFYTAEMTARIRDRVALEGALRHALEREEFHLHYQPQFELSSGRIIGMEALIRWESRELGAISPVRFIPLAEETGLIIPIGRWVLQTACAFTRSLQRSGFADIGVAVNLSARQFRQKDLAQSVADVLAQTELEARFLELEITESMVMHSVEDVLATLKDLHGMGLTLSVDDFGTGYSSLAYLKRFPVHRLKVDRSFVQDIGADEDDTAIVRSIIALGHSLQLQVIAEGVETQAQLDFLSRAGCDQAQGYLLARPMAPDRLRTFLIRRPQFHDGNFSPG